MADLDDFFRKKDKKKGKSKKAIISNEELVRQLEETESKETFDEEKQPVKSSAIEESIENEDDEWASNVEESKRVDFSTLKLGQLTFAADEQEQKQNLTDAESAKLQSDDSENPWSKQTTASNSGPQPSSTVAENKPVSNVYVPPSLKGEMMKNRKKKNLDLSSEGQFPELGTSKPVDRGSGKKDGFEEVKHGAAFKNVQSQQAPVSVGNTYSSLLNDADS